MSISNWLVFMVSVGKCARINTTLHHTAQTPNHLPINKQTTTIHTPARMHLHTEIRAANAISK